MSHIITKSIPAPGFTPGNTPSHGNVLVWDSTAQDYVWQSLNNVTIEGSAVINETPSGTLDGVNNTFTLANDPVDGSLMLFYNGVLQKPGAGNDYTISGNTITFTDPPPGGCATDTLSAWYLREGISRGIFTPLIKTEYYAANTWDEIYCDTTAIGPFTIDSPDNPVLGDTFRIVNMVDSFEDNNLTIGRNGERIMGLEEDLVVDINRSFDLKYSDSNNGWVIY